MSFMEMAQRFAFRVDENKPELLLAGGVVLVVTGSVMACKATLSARDILEEHRREMSDIRELESIKDELKEEDQKKIPVLKTNQYIRTTIEFVKKFAPPIILGGVGIASICFSHYIMNERNVALSMALGSANAALLEYRGRVRKEVGDEVENMIFNGGHKEKVTVYEDQGDGKKPKKREEEFVVYDKPPVAPYSILFDGKSAWWRENCPTANRMVVENVQKTANHLLRTRGYVTLAEVIDMLGFEIDLENDENSWEYLNLGWKESDEAQPMRFVDFDLDSPRLYDFGKTNDTAWLTFNVEPIYTGKKFRNSKGNSLICKAA